MFMNHHKFTEPHSLGATHQIFISYSHDSLKHMRKVLRFSERLRTDGFQVALDRYTENMSQHDRAQWIEQKVNAATCIILICTKKYYHQFYNQNPEGSVMPSYLLEAQQNRHLFIPLIFKYTNGNYVPDPLHNSSLHIIDSEPGYQKLVDTLTSTEPNFSNTISNTKWENPSHIPLIEPATYPAKVPAKAPKYLVTVTPKQYKNLLITRKQEVEQLIKEASCCDVLNKQKVELEQQITHTDKYYDVHVKTLQSAIRNLNDFKTLISEQELEQVQNLLAKGILNSAIEFLTHINTSHKPEDQTKAEFYFQLAQLLEENIDYLQANKYYQKALKIIPNSSRYLQSMGCISNILGLTNIAIGYHEQSLAIALSELGNKSTPEAVTTYKCLGEIWIKKGYFDRGIKCYETALDIYSNVLGKEHPSVAVCCSKLGDVWSETEEHNKALQYYEKALKIYKASIDETHPCLAKIYNSLGLTWQTKGNYNKAIEYYETSLLCYRKISGDNHLSLATCYNNLGNAWQKKQDYDMSINYHKKALNIRSSILGSQHVIVAASYDNLGVTWESKKDFRQAIKYHQKSLEVKLSLLHNDDPSLAITYNNLGNAWSSINMYHNAIENYNKSLNILRNTYHKNHRYIQITQNSLNNIQKIAA